MKKPLHWPKTKLKAIFSVARCTKWVCENDWNEQEGLCTECAPRVNVKIAAAKAQKMVADIEEKRPTPKFLPAILKANKPSAPSAVNPPGKANFAIIAVRPWE